MPRALTVLTRRTAEGPPRVASITTCCGLCGEEVWLSLVTAAQLDEMPDADLYDATIACTVCRPGDLELLKATMATPAKA